MQYFLGKDLKSKYICVLNKNMHSLASDLSSLLSINGLVTLLTLTILEIILGIDNIIFISIAVDKLPREKQAKARTIGLMLALVVRTVLLFFVGYIAGLKEAFFHVAGYGKKYKNIFMEMRMILDLVKKENPLLMPLLCKSLLLILCSHLIVF